MGREAADGVVDTRKVSARAGDGDVLGRAGSGRGGGLVVVVGGLGDDGSRAVFHGYLLTESVDVVAKRSVRNGDRTQESTRCTRAIIVVIDLGGHSIRAVGIKMFGLQVVGQGCDYGALSDWQRDGRAVARRSGSVVTRVRGHQRGRGTLVDYPLRFVNALKLDLGLIALRIGDGRCPCRA